MTNLSLVKIVLWFHISKINASYELDALFERWRFVAVIEKGLKYENMNWVLLFYMILYFTISFINIFFVVRLAKLI